MTIPLEHRPGCPSRTDRVEAYAVVGPGRYDRTTGEYGPPGRSGMVRCNDCAAQALVPEPEVAVIRRELVRAARIASGDEAA